MQKIFSKQKMFGENVKLIQGSLIKVIDSQKIRIKLHGEIEGSQFESDLENTGSGIDSEYEKDIEYDYLAICTGTSYIMNEASPSVDDELVTHEKRLDFLKKYQEDIDKAASILVVGSGWTAIEFLGEILSKYGKSKKYGLLHKDPFLKRLPKKVKKLAESHFQKNHVKFYADPNTERKNRIMEEYEYVLMCTGTKWNTPFMDNPEFKQCKTNDGRIMVNEYFQITNVNPNEAMPPRQGALRKTVTYQNIFWYGDVWVTRMQEIKNISSIRQMSPIVANNIRETAMASDMLLKMPYAVERISNIHFGNWSGVIVSFAIDVPLTPSRLSIVMQCALGWHPLEKRQKETISWLG